MAVVAGDTLGERIRSLRTARGLSQDKLSTAVGMTRQHVYTIERGEVEHLPPKTLKRFAEALDVSEIYLATGYQPEDATDAPPIEVVLRRTTELPESDIITITKMIRALEAEQRRMIADEGLE